MFYLSTLVSASQAPFVPGLAYCAKKHGYPTIYLVGTIHSLTEEQQVPPSAYISIFHLVDRIGFEYDSLSRASTESLQKAFFPPRGRTTSDLFGPDFLEHLRKFCEQDEILDYAEVSSVSPLYAHFLVLQTLNSRSDISPVFGTDSVFRSAADSHGKSLLFLESASDQIRAFEKLGVPYFEAKILDRISKVPDSYRARCDHLYRLWLSGDKTRFEAATGEEMSENFTEYILAERNRAWIPRILTQAKLADDPIAYFVGSAHLFGRDGLVTLMENEGFSVSQITDSASLPSPAIPPRPSSAPGSSSRKSASSKPTPQTEKPKPAPKKKGPRFFPGLRSGF